MKDRLADSSTEFIEVFAILAKKLALMDITVHTLNLYWGSFGSWELMVLKRHEALRFIYDGKDSYLTIESSPVKNHSHPNEWKTIITDKKFYCCKDAIIFVEEFLNLHFAC